MGNKPLVMTENLFDNVVLHPQFVLQDTPADDLPGHELFRVADNLRDMTWFTGAATNTIRQLAVDCIAPAAPNTVILDRGHNLSGATVALAGCASLTLAGPTNLFTSVVPSSPGGLPTDANGCLTPDGVWWKTFTPQNFRVTFLQVSAMGVGITPIVTGLYLGTSYRFAEYLDAPGAYDLSTAVKYLRNEMSRGGVRAKSRGINLDKVAISLSLESVDYPAFDVEVRRMLRYNVPMWFAYDDSDTTGIGQMRLFQFPGDFTYEPRVNPVHREIRYELEEVIPTLYV